MFAWAGHWRWLFFRVRRDMIHIISLQSFDWHSSVGMLRSRIDEKGAVEQKACDLPHGSHSSTSVALCSLPLASEEAGILLVPGLMESLACHGVRVPGLS